MQLFFKNNLTKILITIFAWIITIIAWFFPTLLNNGHTITQHTYMLSSIISFILAIFLSYSIIKSFQQSKTK